MNKHLCIPYGLLGRTVQGHAVIKKCSREFCQLKVLSYKEFL